MARHLLDPTIEDEIQAPAATARPATTPVVTKYEYAAWRPCADVGRARQSAGGGGGRLRSNSGSPLGWLKLAAMSASSAVAIQLNLIAS